MTEIRSPIGLLTLDRELRKKARFRLFRPVSDPRPSPEMTRLRNARAESGPAMFAGERPRPVECAYFSGRRNAGLVIAAKQVVGDDVMRDVATMTCGIPLLIVYRDSRVHPRFLSRSRS